MMNTEQNCTVIPEQSKDGCQTLLTYTQVDVLYSQEQLDYVRTPMPDKMALPERRFHIRHR